MTICGETRWKNHVFYYVTDIFAFTTHPEYVATTPEIRLKLYNGQNTAADRSRINRGCSRMPRVSMRFTEFGAFLYSDLHIFIIRG